MKLFSLLTNNLSFFHEVILLSINNFYMQQTCKLNSKKLENQEIKSFIGLATRDNTKKNSLRQISILS
jgi:hypothetical protein